jgi:hypothetical protein
VTLKTAITRNGECQKGFFTEIILCFFSVAPSLKSAYFWCSVFQMFFPGLNDFQRKTGTCDYNRMVPVLFLLFA